MLSGGRHWVSLGDLAEPGLVPVAIASAVGVPSSAEPLQGVIERLAPTGDALLVLDGCEQVIDAVVDTVVTLLQAAPQLRVLVTSAGPSASPASAASSSRHFMFPNRTPPDSPGPPLSNCWPIGSRVATSR